MNKETFLIELKNGLACLPKEDRDERADFYGEMIEDRMEEGLTEADAVAEIGPVNEVVRQIIADTPFTKLVKEKVNRRRDLRGWEVALIILGFPVWLPLLIAAFAVVLTLYVVAWVLILTLWVIEAAFWVGALGALALAVVSFVQGNALPGLALLGASFVLAGLSILLFFGCTAASKGILALTRKIGTGIKTRFARKESTK